MFFLALSVINCSIMHWTLMSFGLKLWLKINMLINLFNLSRLQLLTYGYANTHMHTNQTRWTACCPPTHSSPVESGVDERSLTFRTGRTWRPKSACRGARAGPSASGDRRRAAASSASPASCTGTAGAPTATSYGSPASWRWKKWSDKLQM